MKSVAEYRINSLSELACQMRFAPQDVRGTQLAAAEDLLLTLDANTAYPADFILFRITGYRPRDVSDVMLMGLALQHDLGLLIENVSETLDAHTDLLAEPVLQIEDVSARFNVTSKTIQRWRRKGLAARRFIFPDGKRRVGFLVSSVERFFATHQDQVANGANFSQVDDAERSQILASAHRLAAACRCCPSELARRIGRKLHRSPVTIVHTLRKHDQENPQSAVLPLAAAEISHETVAKILRGHRRGSTLRTLAGRAGRTRSAVYRVIMDARLARLNRRKVRFIDDGLYHQADAELAVNAIASQQELLVGSAPEEARVPRDLPAYLQSLYRTPLLSPARERALFLKMNFHKFQFVSARRLLDPELARSRDLDELETYLAGATETKNDIVRANLRLVVSVARRHLRPGLSLMELISEGNLVLMRAVEGFDIRRGNRFSTYATLALMKGFARSVPQMLSDRSAGGEEGLLDSLPDYRVNVENDRFADREQVGILLSHLDDRERSVLRAHFGLGSRALPATLDEVAQRMSLSKQRVRQIEKSALAKLREAAGVGNFASAAC